jgi:hemolysin activation/secretion protein
MAWSLPAVAQGVPPSELPGRERFRFEEPAPPRSQPRGTTITLPSTVAPAGAETVKLILREVLIEGGTVYNIEEIATIYHDLLGRRITLAEVYGIAQKITARYGNDGYVLSRVIVPPQQLNPGGAVVRLQIIEGYVDRVEWPAALAKYPDFFSHYGARIIASRPANIRTIERYLLLAGDLPGLKFKNSLKPSPTKPGAATLVVEVEEKPVDALARFDNRGSRARGPLQYFGSATVNNMMRMHEAVTINYAGATQTRELQYAGGGYRQVLTSEGLAAFVNGSYAWGHPGLPVDPILNYATRSAFMEAGLSYPFVRRRERNLSVTALAFGSNDQSDALESPLTRDRLRGVRVRVEADAADEIKGVSQLNVVLSHGFEGFGSTENGNLLASRSQGRVDFTKLEVTATRLQQLIPNLSLLLAAYGQYAFTPLLSPELCGYGGRAFGRAFDPSQLVGDSCLLLLGELRADLPLGVKEITLAQLYLFADKGRLYNTGSNHNLAAVAGTFEGVGGTSVGGGYRLGWQTLWTADLSVAKAVAGPRADTRACFILTGRYRRAPRCPRASTCF